MPEPMEQKYSLDVIRSLGGAPGYEPPKVPGPFQTVSDSSRQMLEGHHKKWDEQIALGNIPKTSIAEADGVNLTSNQDGDLFARRPLTPEQRAALREELEGVVEKIKLPESPEIQKYWTYFFLDRVVDYNDDWTARMIRENLAIKVADGSDAIRSLRGEAILKDPEQERLERCLTIIQDVDLIFDQWAAQYKGLSPSGKIFQTAFSQIPEYMVPDRLKRVYGEIPGIKESKEWPSVSGQIHKATLAYIYLALQSDPRWKKQFEWFRTGKGIKAIFPNESTERDWLLKFKLATLPNEKDIVAHLRGKPFDTLSKDDIALLDSLPAHNRFADPANGGTINAINGSIEDLLCEGSYHNDPALRFQAKFASSLAVHSFKFLGLAGMYSTRAIERELVDGKMVTKEVAAEAYPWADASLDLMRPRDKNIYNEQSDYWTGPKSWMLFAPKHLMVDFLKMLPIRDDNFPESKAMTRSAWEQLRDGKTLGEIMSNVDHIGDWAYRAYLIRFLFGYREDSGALQFMSGSLVTAKKDAGVQGKFWDDGEKSIHINCRDWIITEGEYEEWFEKHKVDVDKKEAELQKKTQGKVDHDKLRRKAENMVLKDYVKRRKNRWKGIAWLANTEQIHNSKVLLETYQQAALSVDYLDKNLINRSINYDSKEDMESFLRECENSKN